MYAIIKTGGKQYKVAPGDIIDVELLNADLGTEVKFDVLFMNNGNTQKVGAPFIDGASVIGELIDWAAAPKVTSIKYKQRQRQCRKFGHRQKYSRIKITSISDKEHEKHERKDKEL